MSPDPRVRWRGRHDDEAGFALVATMIAVSILSVLTMGMLATGIHVEQATQRDRRWNDALQVAEAGVDLALYERTVNASYTGTGSSWVAVPGGEYQALVTSSEAGWLTITATGVVPNHTSGVARQRRVQVTFGPQASFEYALFSDTGLTVKNNDGTTGDVFANESIVMDNNSGVNGNVVSANGTVSLSNGAEVHDVDGESGNVYSGGYDLSGSWGISLSNNAVIEGSAYAEAETCPGTTADNSRYNISNSGRIEGNATARGSINGTVNGTKTPYNCQLRHSSKILPEYHYDAGLYTGETEYNSISAFSTWVSANSSSLTGTHYVNVAACGSDPTGSSNVIDLGGRTITGDFTLITNCRVDFNNNTSYSGSSDATVSIIVLNSSTSPPAINIKNNFTIPDPSPAVLLYSEGLIEVKNNTESNGAVYAGAVSIKNNLDITYDPRVERTVGFGDLRYDRVTWRECRAASTGSDC